MDATNTVDRVASGPVLDAIVTESVPYGPGLPGYEWITDRMVMIHPSALDNMRRSIPGLRVRVVSGGLN